MDAVCDVDYGRPMMGARSRFALWGMIGLCLLLFVYQTISIQGVIGSDAVVFYDAVKRALSNPALLYHDGRSVPDTARSLQGFLYPPPSIAMLLPFGLGSPEQGHRLLSFAALICAIAAILAWLTLAERYAQLAINRVERAALVLMAVVTGAVFACRFGQVDTLILAIVTLGIWLHWQQQPRWGAAVLAAGSWIKIYPALLMLPLLARRGTRWPTLLGFGLGGAGILTIALVIFPLTAWRDFFSMLPIMAERTIVNIDNQSILAIWARTVVPAEQALTSYDPIVVPAILRGAVSLTAVGTIAAFMWRARQVGASQLWVAAAATAIISLIAPLGWGHSYAYVLPLLMLNLGLAWRARAGTALTVGLAIWAMLVIPAHRQFPMISEDSVLWHIAYARYAIAAILLLALSWWQMRWAAQNDVAAGTEGFAAA
jgi:alpha-1,2-mannosyltransferase